MGAVLWSAVLHAALHSTQLLQPLHSPTPDWSQTSQLTTSTKHTNKFPNPWGPGRAPRHAQGITDRTYWGPS